MNSKHLNLVICAISFQSIFSSAKPKQRTTDSFSASESACDVSSYARHLASANVAHRRKNYSLATIIEQCSRSRNLDELVRTNIASGGQPTNTDNFDRDQSDAPFFWGYDRTALGVLARQKNGGEDKEVAQDMKQATESLLQHGMGANFALLDAFHHQNVPVAQALINSGAHPNVKVLVGCNPTGSNSVSARMVIQHDLFNSRLLKYEAYARAIQAFIFRTKTPDGSSVAVDYLKAAQIYSEQVAQTKTFIKKLSHKQF